MADVPDVTAENQSDRDIVFIAAETILRNTIDGEFALGHALPNNLIVLDASASDRTRLLNVLHTAFRAAEQNRSLID